MSAEGSEAAVNGEPVAGLSAPRTLSPRSAPVLRWGVLGPGGIAATFVEALRTYTHQQVVAVGSRSAERAEAFARRFAIPAAHGSYAGLLADDRVDIVYVASPHSEHFAHAKAAIEAGRHVLVEKAFTRNAREAEELVAAARSRGVFLMEAMWTRCLPQTDVVRQCLESGALGEVRAVFADLGRRMDPDPANRCFAPELAGGALLDLGVYPLSFASMALGPCSVASVAGSATHTGVDGEASVILVNDDGAHGIVHTTMYARTPTTASICGSLGRLELRGEFHTPTTMDLFDRAGRLVDSYRPVVSDDGYAYEAAEAARCVAGGRLESQLMPLEETLRLMRMLDDVRGRLGVRYPGE
ncbi:Gfo/Idh/MocA family oxidoreductase [Streptomyces sp. ICBB 8177]|uniref:Gfo/Idh/MocA family protein n=1 Tax=Streptomyces sp. ICBB 8177 TaxID=563922 RepID=UPI000D67F513|nr:Gfo/Idh/MocA family oxidoreductase [Streptomyces sp. ICBB 8177]PWI44850.1 oxidoreductase [Streptomyces sp. ICBB 8177]